MSAGFYPIFTFANYTEANAQAEELVALAEEKGSLFLKAHGKMIQGPHSALTGEAYGRSRSTHLRDHRMACNGSDSGGGRWPSCFASAYAELGQLDDAWRCMGEVMTTMEATKERWWEAEVDRMAGEIALQIAAARNSESGNLFRKRARRRPPAASEILGTPRRYEHGAALARSGQAAGSSRTPRSGLRLVHRRFRHARSKGSEGVARHSGLIATRGPFWTECFRQIIGRPRASSTATVCVSAN